MDANREKQLDALFHALSDGTRRMILSQLLKKEATVGEIAAPIEMSLNGVSKHIKVLEKAGLIARRRHGREHHCSANFEALKVVRGLIMEYDNAWSARLDALDAFLKRQNE